LGNRGYSKYFNYLNIITDIGLIYLAFWIITIIWDSSILSGFEIQAITYLIVVTASYIFISLFSPPINLFDLRKISYPEIIRYEFIRSIGLTIGVLLVIALLIGSILYAALIHLFVYFILLIFSRAGTSIWVKIYRSKGYNYRNIVLLSNDQTDDSFKSNIELNPQLGYRQVGTFEINEILKSDNSLLVFEKKLKELEIDEVLIDTHEVLNTEIEKILNVCDRNYIKTWFVSGLGVHLGRKLQASALGNHILMEVSPHPLEDPLLSLSKRLFDVLFSIVVFFLVLIWLIPVLALIILIDSKGHVFFRQKRTGMRGEEFTCYKFRTMRINSMADKTQATKNDARITKVGQFLRKSSLDELPQFWNVLLNDMSVVGPRPHMLAHTDEFSKRTENYFERHSIKPGITGMAQINGFRGEISDQAELEGRIKWDRYYVENWTLMLDLQIIMKTIIQMLTSHPKAY